MGFVEINGERVHTSQIQSNENDISKTITKDTVSKRIDRFMKRAGGDVICNVCNKMYKDHPLDNDVLTYYPDLNLNKICNGILAKL